MLHQFPYGVPIPVQPPDFPLEFLKRIGFKRLAIGVGVSDIFRLSTVKYERGTSYPYCRTINLTFRPTF